MINKHTLILGAVKADDGAIVNQQFCGSKMGLATGAAAAMFAKTVCSK